MEQKNLNISNRLKVAISNASQGNFHHIWLIRPKKQNHSFQMSTFYEILSAEERDRMKGFKFPVDQYIFLVSHVTLRLLLGEYVQLLPESLLFQYGTRGKPYLHLPNQEIHFNLSHTKEHICVLVSSHVCGVDVEKNNPSFPIEEVAGKIFSPAECKELFSRSGEGRILYFFQLWTLKEAYLKATGEGISNRLTSVSFDIPKVGEIDLEDLSIKEPEEEWVFRSYFHLEDAVVSCALKTSAPVNIHNIEWLPCGTLDICNSVMYRPNYSNYHK